MIDPQELDELRQALARRRAELEFAQRALPAPKRAAEYLAAFPPSDKAPESAPVLESAPNLPTKIKFWPLVGLAAIQSNHGGAWRLWALAKALDAEGSGVADRAALLAFCNHLGINRRSFFRWLRDAKKIGLLRQIVRRDKNVVFILAGLARAADLLGAGQVGKPAKLPAAKLAGGDWRAWAWAGFLATCQGRPISRAQMRALTGVPEQTQRDYERAAHVIPIENYGVTARPADQLAGVQEFERPHAFIFNDKSSGGPKVAYRIPNSYSISGIVETAPKGRSRKAQKALLKTLIETDKLACSSWSAALSLSVRLYHDALQGAKSTLRKIGRADLPILERPPALYVWRFRGLCQTWQVVAVEAGA